MDKSKNPQTTIALTFMTHIISGIDGVYHYYSSYCAVPTCAAKLLFLHNNEAKFKCKECEDTM